MASPVLLPTKARAAPIDGAGQTRVISNAHRTQVPFAAVGPTPTFGGHSPLPVWGPRSAVRASDGSWRARASAWDATALDETPFLLAQASRAASPWSQTNLPREGSSP